MYLREVVTSASAANSITAGNESSTAAARRFPSSQIPCPFPQHETPGREFLCIQWKHLSDLGTKDGDNHQAKDLNNQGLALMDQQEWNKDEAAFKGAIALDPEVALWYYNLGHLYVK